MSVSVPVSAVDHPTPRSPSSSVDPVVLARAGEIFNIPLARIGRASSGTLKYTIYFEDGRRVEGLTARDLMGARTVRRLVFEQTRHVMPHYSPTKWTELLPEVEAAATPEGLGVLEAALAKFLRSTRPVLNSNPWRAGRLWVKSSRDLLWFRHDGVRWFYGTAFYDFCLRTGIDMSRKRFSATLKGSGLASKTVALTVGRDATNRVVWRIPADLEARLLTVR